jgi:predicted metal-dependent phosphoesterase TrpH
MMLRPFRMDLHIHTCLSPCGMPENVPTKIIEKAQERRLQAIGICDHNASENVAAVRKAAEKSAIQVFGGMEVTTEEEIHILAIFESDDDLHSLQNLVYENLPGKNDPEAFGQQYIVDKEDYVTKFNERLLMGATGLNLNDVIDAIHKYKGLAIASHIDRDAFSIIGQLGMIPDDLELDAVELSRHYMDSQFELGNIGFPCVMFSDAHQLEDIGSVCTSFTIESPSVAEIIKALQGLEGREIVSESSSGETPL